MAQHKSAKKRIRSNEKRKTRNKGVLSKVKTLVKNVRTAEDKAKAEEHLKTAVSYLDKIGNKKVLHKNNISRKKSSLTRYVNSLKAAEK